MKDFFGSSKFFVMAVTTILFTIGYVIAMPIAQMIIASLSFLILLEIITAINEYMLHPEHNLNIKGEI